MICASCRLTLESAGRGRLPALVAICKRRVGICGGKPPVALAVCRDRIRHRHRDGECRSPHRLTLFAYWGGNRIGDHRRKHRAVVAVGARRIGIRGSRCERRPSHQRLVCANRNRRWGLRRKWGDFGAIDRTSYRHRIFWRGHGGKRSAVADQPVRSDWGRYRECGGYRGVAGHQLIRIAEQCVWRGFVFWGASDNFDHTVQWVSIYRRASQSRVRLCVLPCRNAARSRADCIDKLCGEGAVKTLTTNRLWVVNHIDNLLHKIEGNHHGR